MPASAARQGVFISYSRQDGEALALELHRRLQRDAPDVRAWLDRADMEGGLGWWSQIERELDRAEFLLIVLTPAAVVSENTRREWRCARERGVCVYPVLGVPGGDIASLNLPRWMSRRHIYDPVAQWQTLLGHLRAGCRTPYVPFMAPPLLATHVMRPEQVERVLHALIQDGQARARAVAIRGAGGFGKSTLAAEVCHDDRALDAFDDGILWVTLGPTPNVLGELAKLYAALSGERPGFVDVEDAVRELGSKLEHRSCLIVIDDVWHARDVRPFMRGGAGCARLITTRAFDVALEAQRIDLGAMTPDEAVHFLQARVGTLAPAAPLLRELAVRVGGWPLLLKLAGSVLREALERGDRSERALGYVLHALRTQGVAAFDDPDGDRSEAVQLTIDISLNLLDEATRRRCADLVVFDEGETVPLSTAATLWGLHEFDAQDVARRLDNLGLVELDLRLATLRQHGMLREYLSKQADDLGAVHARLLDAWGDLHALPDPNAWRTVARHLRCAGRDARLRELLLDAQWLAAKLTATDAHALAADFEATAPDPVLAIVGDALRLAAPALAAEPRELQTQLVARLLGQQAPELKRLCLDAVQAARGPWLRLLHPTLNAPGGMLLTTLTGHERAVQALALDAGAGRLLSGSADATTCLWNIASGQLLERRDNFALGVRGVGLAASGSEGVAACGNGRLYCWRVGIESRPRSLAGDNRRALVAVAVSRDGRLAVVASREKFIEVWDLHAGCKLHELRGHEDEVTSVAVSADGRHAVSGSEDGTVRIWHTSHGVLEHVLRGHRGAVNAVAMSESGRIAISGSTDRTLRRWDALRGELLGVLSGHGATIRSVALAEQGTRALSGADNAEALLWDLSTGQVIAHLEGHADAVLAVAIDEQGRRAATASADGTAKVWRLDHLKQRPAPDRHAGSVHALAFSSDGQWCASGGADGDIIVRDVASGQVLRRLVAAHAAAVRSLCFSADDSCVISSAMDGQYWLWPIDQGDGSWIPIRHFAPVLDDAVSSRFVISTCGDRSIYVWEAASGARVARWSTRRLFDHLIEPAVQRARAAAADDSLLEVYLGAEPFFEVHAVAASPIPGRMVLSASKVDRAPGRGHAGDALRYLLVLDIEQRAVSTVEITDPAPIRAFALDASGERLVLARADNSVEMRSVQGAQAATVLRGHQARVTGVAFASEGRTAVTCSHDRSLRMWDLASGRMFASFTADSALRTLAVSPGPGGVLAAGDSAGQVHLLRVSSGP